jgi:translation initiation factor IF-2
MAQVTVKQLAALVGTPADRMLVQMKDAGLKHKNAEDAVSDAEKMVLLKYLKTSHGESTATAEPKKVTLKRKVTSTLKSGGAGGKAVSIEVRKKRTFVKEEETTAKAKTTEKKPEPKKRAPESKTQKPAAKPDVARKPAPAADKDKSKAPKQFRSGDKLKGGARTSDRGNGRREGGAGKARRKGKGGRNAVQSEHTGEHGFTKPTAEVIHEVELIGEFVTVGELAQKMTVKGVEVIKALMGMGVMATINQPLDNDTATLVVEEMGHKVTLVQDNAVEVAMIDSIIYEGEEVTRAPVVTVMGHVDHGKTSLLDYIRSSKVTTGEAGGITQHIGAYHVDTDKGMVTFLDTPGHAAFTSMRARGATSTDIVILVVASDDGVMPQTEEAIQHAKAAGVPIVVAINKMDKEGADPDRVKTELSAKGVVPEDWGGDVQFMPVSALTGAGVQELLDAVLLQADMLELKAVPNAPATGVVIESRLDKGRGPVATLLVQNGTINKGDIILAGTAVGRVRALIDEDGRQIKSAGPAIPVEILGLGSIPDAGDGWMIVENERKAREVVEFREERTKQENLQRQQAAKLDAMFKNMDGAKRSVLNIVLKTDVKGSLEAITSSLAQIGNDEVEVVIVSSGVGGIAETDANLALASNAVIFGFNVRADASARKVIESNEIDLRYYSIIYDMLDDVKDALSGMLAPEMREEIVGIAEVREVFKSPKFGLIAGSMVLEGTVYRSKKIRVLRENVVVYEGELESLRRYKDDVEEVRMGTDCGIGVKNYLDVQPGDQIEVFEVREIERSL